MLITKYYQHGFPIMQDLIVDYEDEEQIASDEQNIWLNVWEVRMCCPTSWSVRPNEDEESFYIYEVERWMNYIYFLLHVLDNYFDNEVIISF